MATAPPPTPRASLLAGLRTGGVRSTSSAIPHTAAPTASFNIPRFASQHHAEEHEDHLPDMPSQSVFSSGNRTMPITAAVDGPNNRFAHQMGQRGLNPNSIPFSPAAFTPNMVAQQNNMQNQALQMQILQLEMMRMQVSREQSESRHSL